MREYGCISPKFWVGKTGRSLRGHQDAQLVALYLMSCPSAEMYGVFYCSMSSIAHEVGFDLCPSEGASKGLLRVKQALSMLHKEGFLVYDFESEYVFIKEFAKWQVADHLSANDKRVISARNATESMPEPLRSMFIERYNEAFHLGLEPSPSEGASMPLRSQEQEQEQDNKEIYKENSHSASHSVPTPEEPLSCTPKKVDLVEKVKDVYNDVTSGRFTHVKVLTEKRRKAVRKFIDFYRKQVNAADDEQFLKAVREYFLRAIHTDFLCGKNERGWKADFDFLMNENKSVLFLEGKYDNALSESDETDSIFKVAPEQRCKEPPKGWSNPFEAVPTNDEEIDLSVFRSFK